VLNEPEVTLLAVWTLGFALGLTACTVTCLPFIGTWSIGRAEAGRNGLADTLAFLGGRLVSYTALGAFAGGLGDWFIRILAAGSGHLLIGLAAQFAALWLVWPGRDASCMARSRLAGMPPFLLGAALTLIPCAPLATLLASCAAEAQAQRGALFGLVFGLGALLSPLLVLIPATASLGKLLRRDEYGMLPWLRAGAALVLLALAWRRIALLDADLASGLIVITLLIGLLGRQRSRRPANSAPRVLQPLLPLRIK
jgi:thiol:disulfide interchange protein DsbD